MSVVKGKISVLWSWLEISSLSDDFDVLFSLEVQIACHIFRHYRESCLVDASFLPPRRFEQFGETWVLLFGVLKQNGGVGIEPVI